MQSILGMKLNPGESRTISFEAIPPVIYSEKKQRQKIRISRVGLRLGEEEAQLQGVVNLGASRNADHSAYHHN